MRPLDPTHPPAAVPEQKTSDSSDATQSVPDIEQLRARFERLRAVQPGMGLAVPASGGGSASALTPGSHPHPPASLGDRCVPERFASLVALETCANAPLVGTPFFDGLKSTGQMHEEQKLLEWECAAKVLLEHADTHPLNRDKTYNVLVLAGRELAKEAVMLRRLAEHTGHTHFRVCAVDPFYASKEQRVPVIELAKAFSASVCAGVPGRTVETFLHAEGSAVPDGLMGTHVDLVMCLCLGAGAHGASVAREHLDPLVQKHVSVGSEETCTTHVLYADYGFVGFVPAYGEGSQNIESLAQRAWAAGTKKHDF